MSHYSGVVLLLVAALPLQAQTPDPLAMGVARAQARDPRAALVHFQSALRQDSTGYEANWRAAQAAVDIGKQTPDSVRSETRDSLYALAERYARRAVQANPAGAEGHFMLAVAVGRASLTRSRRERVRRAGEIRSEALRAIELDSTHDGAWHVLGRWHAEVMRLSGFERFFAKSFLGGGIFNEASWDRAVDCLTRAVNLAPDNIYHRLDLAEIYIDRERYAEAREQLERIAALPVVDVMDPAYQARAAALLQRIRDRR